MSDARLHQLLAGYCEGGLQPDEQAELLRLCREQPEARQRLADLVLMDRGLTWVHLDEGPQTFCAEVRARLEAEAATDPGFVGSILARIREEQQAASPTAFWLRWFGRAWVRPLAAGFAALAVVGLTLWLSVERPSGLPASRTAVSVSSAAFTNGIVAELVQARGVGWGLRQSPLTEGTQLKGGVIRLATGQIRLRFVSDVLVTLAGPAELVMLDPIRVRLVSGQLKAVVGKRGKGFTVETPEARIVDYGTEFGVDTGKTGITDVVVFQGSVDVLGNSGNRALRRLTMGESLRVDAGQRLSRIITVTADRSGDNWSTRRDSGMSSVVEAVRDNLRGLESVKYYEIVPAGLMEGARAYVDRGHRWKSVGTNGFPHWLAGADLVRTFNDDKRQKNISLSLTLARPAVIYVLMDKRRGTPQWLGKSFSKTGAEVVMEEVVDSSKPEMPGQDSGSSSERSFDVWKFEATEGGVVSLGPPGRAGGLEPKAMYGIAVSPLEDWTPSAAQVPALAAHIPLDDAAGSLAREAVGAGRLTSEANVELGRPGPGGRLRRAAGFEPAAGPEPGGISLGQSRNVYPRDQFTITLWMQPLELQSNARLLDASGDQALAAGYRLKLDDQGSGHLQFLTAARGTGVEPLTHTTLLRTGVWYFVAARLDTSAHLKALTVLEQRPAAIGSGQVREATEQLAYSGGPLGYGSDPARLGANNSKTSGKFFRGNIADVRFYRGVLGEAGLAELFNLAVGEAQAQNKTQ